MAGTHPKVLMLLGSYDAAAHAGIARASRELGWHLDVSLLKTFQLPERWRGDGIVTSLNRSKRLEHFVRRAGKPTVDLSIWRADLPYPRVAADNGAIGIEAARHFMARGHHSYAWFALSSNPVGESRFKGYRDELESSGHTVTRLDKRGAQDSGTIRRRLSRLPKPCACFCKSDDDAAWLLSVCLESGIRVPEELALLGVDNNRLICENQPVPLSSVNHDLDRIGYLGAHLLAAIIRGERPEPATRLISPNGVTTRTSSDSLAIRDPAILNALEFMRHHLRRSISTGHIAQAANLSRRTLEQRFKQQIHCTVHAKLVELRLQSAARELVSGHASIEDIAALCGFANAPHFSRSFKAAYGMPPLKYRKQAGTALSA